MKVLLIEPMKLYLQMIYEILGNINIKVHMATSGSEGLQYLKEHDYEFILGSKNLPDITAMQFA